MMVKNLIQQIIDALINAKDLNGTTPKGKIRRKIAKKWKQAYDRHSLALYLWALGHYRATLSPTELELLLNQFAQEISQRKLQLDQAHASSMWWIQEFKRWYKVQNISVSIKK